MKRTRKLLRMFGTLTFLAVASLALPLSSHAGGVHVSIGLGLPFPVVVAPQEHVPVVVHPAPVIVARPPVMVAGPHVVYTRPYYGGHRHWGDHRHGGGHRHWGDHRHGGGHRHGRHHRY